MIDQNTIKLLKNDLFDDIFHSVSKKINFTPAVRIDSSQKSDQHRLPIEKIRTSKVKCEPQIVLEVRTLNAEPQKKTCSCKTK